MIYNATHNLYTHDGDQGQIDEMIIKSVAEEYAAAYARASGKVVMDIGGNIGSTVVQFAKTAKLVVTYEPEPQNIDILTKNVGSLTNVIVHKAGIGTVDTSMTLYTARRKNQGLHSLLKVRGRVPVIVDIHNFSSALQKYRPQILKFDAEGAEQLVRNELSALPDFVETIAIEFDVNPGRMVANGLPWDASLSLFNAIKAQFPVTHLEKLPPVNDTFASMRNGLYVGSRASHD